MLGIFVYLIFLSVIFIFMYKAVNYFYRYKQERKYINSLFL